MKTSLMKDLRLETPLAAINIDNIPLDILDDICNLKYGEQEKGYSFIVLKSYLETFVEDVINDKSEVHPFITELINFLNLNSKTGVLVVCNGDEEYFSV